MSTDERTSPEQCPQPFWHKTHCYCPCCTWTEQPEPPYLRTGQLVAAALNGTTLPPHCASCGALTEGNGRQPHRPGCYRASLVESPAPPSADAGTVRARWSCMQSGHWLRGGICETCSGRSADAEAEPKPSLRRAMEDVAVERGIAPIEAVQTFGDFWRRTFHREPTFADGAYEEGFYVQGWQDATHAAQRQPAAEVAALRAVISGQDCALFVLYDRTTARVLMEWRDEAGRWVFPGGKIEPDETPIAAAYRECQEEVGVQPYHLERVEMLPTRGFYGHPMHVYRATAWRGVVQAREGQRLEWRTLTEALDDPMPCVHNVAAALAAAPPAGMESGFCVDGDHDVCSGRAGDEACACSCHFAPPVAPPADTCEACGHRWRWHTQGGMCAGSDQGIECYCALIPPADADAPGREA